MLSSVYRNKKCKRKKEELVTNMNLVAKKKKTSSRRATCYLRITLSVFLYDYVRVSLQSVLVTMQTVLVPLLSKQMGTNTHHIAFQYISYRNIDIFAEER